MIAAPTQVEQLEQHLANAKELVQRRNDAVKLSESRLFRKLILEEFCDKESARFVHASSDPALSAEQRADALALAQAGGHLKRWLSMQVQMGAHSERQIVEIEQELEQARLEEAEVDHDERDFVPDSGDEA